MSDSVYHQIQVQKGLDEMRFTLCGSIMDEAWILNFLHQLTNFTEPYLISSWKKSFAEPFTFTISNLFFLISPNCLKCYELQAYALSNLRQKRLAYSNLMIDTVVVPSSCREFSDVIDVSSMNQKEIAKEIVSRANSKSAFNYILYFHSKHIKNELLNTVQISFKHKVALLFHLVDTVPSEIEGHIVPKSLYL